MPTRKKMPRQKPSESKQDYGTPGPFLDAARSKLKIRDFEIDLAATKRNRVVARFFSRRDNALKQDWKTSRRGVAWLNPEFGLSGAFVQKAHASRRSANVAVLVPAAVGSNWWRKYVHRKARVLFLNGRITFVGMDQGYVKDCALVLFGRRWSPGYSIWRWPDQKVRRRLPRWVRGRIAGR